LILLAEFLPSQGINYIDCQVPNDHLLSMGAQVWPRDRFLDALEQWINQSTQIGSWEDSFQTFLHQQGG